MMVPLKTYFILKANTEISKSILNIMKMSNAAKIFTGNSSTAE